MTIGRILQGIATLILPFGVACKPERNAQGPQASAPPTVYTTFYPTTYFAERIGGKRLLVVCPCPADADPAYWMPDDATITAYQRAGLILINGAGFEKWIDNTALPQAALINTSKPLAGELIELQGEVSHSHGPSGAHTHAGLDGHTWVDPLNAKLQAQQIADACVRAWPAHADEFRQNMMALAADLDKLQGRMPAVTEALAQRTLLCSHPAYNYLARRNGWTVVNFHLEPNEAPAAEELTKVAAACADKRAALMLWEDEPLKEAADLLRTRFGLESVVFAPAETLDDAQRATGVDYLTIMNDNVDRLLAALKAGKPAD
jgi:zinc transport system substrate-binding protein